MWTVTVIWIFLPFGEWVHFWNCTKICRWKNTAFLIRSILCKPTIVGAGLPKAMNRMWFIWIPVWDLPPLWRTGYLKPNVIQAQPCCLPIWMAMATRICCWEMSIIRDYLHFTTMNRRNPPISTGWIPFFRKIRKPSVCLPCLPLRSSMLITMG